jgi:two-component system catabolic regulation response regulator CreB
MPDSILIVEDEAAIADSIAYALRTEGYVPHHVTLGQLALAVLRAPDVMHTPISLDACGHIALVVLDVGLPDINGFEVCRRLRQFSDVPVIFLTARNDEIDRIVGLEIGADDYISKPFSPRELVARIRVILRRVARSDAAPAGGVIPPSGPAAAPARFELRAKEARIAFCGQLLELTRYEFLLLKAFIEHPGHVLSRAQLMDKVWTDAPDTLDRTVDAHVKALRAKLREIDPQQDPIQTHRGMGYSLAST